MFGQNRPLTASENRSAFHLLQFNMYVF
jgi:hypothetical protein